ncbi:hypothetical protein [Rhodococcus sp. NPDC127528]|uniref:hypothetical protein n=1 Tax=unclassified Rhodococcus (in: high G+C Gram-positive bacteria) TaxID=192944 RepID=UPI00363FD7A2
MPVAFLVGYTMPRTYPTGANVAEFAQQVGVRAAAPEVGPRDVSAALGSVDWQSPAVSANTVAGLKFSAALPPDLAVGTLHPAP